MESSSPAPVLDPSNTTNIKFIILGIVIAFIYGFSTFLLVFTFLPVFFIFLSYFIGDQQDLVIVLTPLISTLSGGLAAFLSGRAAFRSANKSGSIWNVVIGTIVSVVVGIFGVLFFSVLIYFIGGLIYGNYYEWSAGAGIALIATAFTLGCALAYGTAVIAGALTHSMLARRSIVLRNNAKIEEGLS